MDWIVSAYWICLIIGVGYTIISFVLGEIGSIGHVGDAQGGFSHDYGVHGHGGHGEASGTDSGGSTLLFGPFSPLVIAFFLTAFGAAGLIITRLWPQKPGAEPNFYLPLALALVAGFVLAWLLYLFFNRVLGRLQSSSEVRLHTLVGTEAEVTVAIPEVGTGEIAYVAMGSRCLTPAQSEHHLAIPRFATVRVVRIVGNIFHVEQTDVVPAAPAGGVDAPVATKPDET